MGWRCWGGAGGGGQPSAASAATRRARSARTGRRRARSRLTWRRAARGSSRRQAARPRAGTLSRSGNTGSGAGSGLGGVGRGWERWGGVRGVRHARADVRPQPRHGLARACAAGKTTTGKQAQAQGNGQNGQEKAGSGTWSNVCSRKPSRSSTVRILSTGWPAAAAAAGSRRVAVSSASYTNASRSRSKLVTRASPAKSIRPTRSMYSTRPRRSVLWCVYS